MNGPRWLDDEQQEAWRTYLFATVLLQESLDRQLQRDAGIPHSYYVILAVLGEEPDRSLTMGEIAEVTRSSPSRTSHALARLEERGWVRRCRHPDNARKVLAVLTDAGYDAVAAAAAEASAGDPGPQASRLVSAPPDDVPTAHGPPGGHPVSRSGRRSQQGARRSSC